jgi:hypothetical protein
MDKRCLVCGYSLKGVDPDGACPECGAVPLPTPAHHVLATAPRHYLTRLRRGMLLLEAAGIIAALAIALPTVLSLPAAISDSPFAEAIEYSVGVLIIALLLAGSWQATAPDPRFRTADTLHRARRLVRPAALWIGCFLLAQLGLRLSQSVSGRPLTAAMNWLPDWLIFVPAVLFAVANVWALIVAWIYGLKYLRELARRGSDESLASAAWRRTWVFPLGIIAVSPAAGLLEILPAPVGSILPAIIGAAFIVWSWVWPFDRFRRLVAMGIEAKAPITKTA